MGNVPSSTICCSTQYSFFTPSPRRASGTSFQPHPWNGVNTTLNVSATCATEVRSLTIAITLAMNILSVSSPSREIIPRFIASSKSTRFTPVKISIFSRRAAIAAACWGGSCAPSAQ